MPPNERDLKIKTRRQAPRYDSFLEKSTFKRRNNREGERSEETGGRLNADICRTPQAVNKLVLGLWISLAMVENIGLRAQKHARGLRRNQRPGTFPHECMTLLPCNERLIPMGEVQLILPCAPLARRRVG